MHVINTLFQFIIWLTARVVRIDKAEIELKYRRLLTWLKLYCWQNFFFWGCGAAFCLTAVTKGIDVAGCLSSQDMVVLNFLLLLFAVEYDFMTADRGLQRYPFFYQAQQKNHIFRTTDHRHGYTKFKGYTYQVFFLTGGVFFAYFELRDKGQCSGLWITALRVLCLLFLIQTLLLLIDALVENRD